MLASAPANRRLGRCGNAQTQWFQSTTPVGCCGVDAMAMLTESSASDAARGSRCRHHAARGPAGGGFGAALSSFGFGGVARKNGAARICGFCRFTRQPRSNLPLELSRFGHAAYACELCLHLCPARPRARGVAAVCDLSRLLWMGCRSQTNHRRWRCGCLNSSSWPPSVLRFSWTDCAACGAWCRLRRLFLSMESAVACSASCAFWVRCRFTWDRRW